MTAVIPADTAACKPSAKGKMHQTPKRRPNTLLPGLLYSQLDRLEVDSFDQHQRQLLLLLCKEQSHLT